MARLSAKMACAVVVCAAVVPLGAAGCGRANATPTAPTTTSSGYRPAWVIASWGFGITGNPTDRRDEDAVANTDSICRASSVRMTNWSGGFAGLTLINNCVSTVTYYVCATAGQRAQPQFGLRSCASDALQTSLGNLTVVTLLPGPPGFGINANRDLSLQLFFCGQQTTLSGPPLRCR